MTHLRKNRRVVWWFSGVAVCIFSVSLVIFFLTKSHLAQRTVVPSSWKPSSLASSRLSDQYLFLLVGLGHKVVMREDVRVSPLAGNDRNLQIQSLN